VVRGLAIAALAALGQAGDANVDQVMGLMSEPNTGMCMNMSKLNLYQCLAVARPHYEDVFCLGQHAMMDTGRCLIKSRRPARAYEARFIPDASSVAKKMVVPKKAPRRRPGRRNSPRKRRKPHRCADGAFCVSTRTLSTQLGTTFVAARETRGGFVLRHGHGRDRFER